MPFQDVKSLGGFPLIGIPSSTKTTFNLETILGTLARQFGLTPLLSVSVRGDFNNATKNSLYLDPGDLGSQFAIIYLDADRIGGENDKYNSTMQKTLMALSGML